MKKLFFLTLCCLCLFAYSCTGDKKERDRKQIQALELSTLQDAKVISYEKADSLISLSVDPLSKVRLVRYEQPSKANASIVVTVAGILIEDKLLH